MYTTQPLHLTQIIIYVYGINLSHSKYKGFIHTLYLLLMYFSFAAALIPEIPMYSSHLNRAHEIDIFYAIPLYCFHYWQIFCLCISVSGIIG